MRHFPALHRLFGQTETLPDIWLMRHLVLDVIHREVKEAVYDVNDAIAAPNAVQNEIEGET